MTPSSSAAREVAGRGEVFPEAAEGEARRETGFAWTRSWTPWHSLSRALSLFSAPRRGFWFVLTVTEVMVGGF